MEEVNALELPIKKIIVLKRNDTPDPLDEWDRFKFMLGQLGERYGECLVLLTEDGHAESIDDDGLVELVENRLMQRGVSSERIVHILDELRGGLFYEEDKALWDMIDREFGPNSDQP